MYRDQGQQDQALKQYQQALVITREIGDRAMEGTTLNNIGVELQAQGQQDQALNQYRSALVIAREVGAKALEGTVLANIASLPDSSD